MAFTEDLRIFIDANVGGFTRAMRSVNDDTTKVSRSLGGLRRGVGQFAKFAAIGLAGVGVAAGAMGLDFVRAAEESIKVTRQTEAVLKSTGGVANVTAGQVAKLAEKLSLKAGIDDELIQSGANVLLTFTKVRDEVGKGNDVFSQATTLALDMSVALGQDLQSSVTLVGKALNDPIKGLTSLTRAGVQFTEQQKEQIRALVESGDVLGAQKIILAELATQFEGSAAAQATATDKLKVAFGNVAEQIGMVLLPFVNQFSDWLVAEGIPLIRDQFIPALQDFAHWVGDELVPDLQDTGRTLRDDVVPAVQRLTEAIAALPSAVQLALASLGLLAKFGGFGVLASAAVLFGKVAATAIGFVGAAATIAFGLIMKIAPFGHLVTLALIFRDRVAGAFRSVGELAARVFSTLRTNAATNINTIAAFFRALPGRIAGGIGTIASIFRSAMAKAWNAVTDFVGRIVDAIKSIPGKIGNVAGRIKDKIAGALGGIDLTPGFDLPGFGGFLAHGGPARAGTPYVVGERGPEVFIPSRSGMVVPTGAGGRAVGAQTVVTYNMTFNGPTNSQQVIEAIKSYERTNGRGWRS